MRERGIRGVCEWRLFERERLSDELFKKGADVGLKVVRKTDPNERVGVIVTKNGRPAIVEYGEMPAEEVSRVNSNGDLVHSAGNICIHGFSLPFLERMANEKVWEKMEVDFSFSLSLSLSLSCSLSLFPSFSLSRYLLYPNMYLHTHTRTHTNMHIHHSCTWQRGMGSSIIPKHVK